MRVVLCLLCACGCGLVAGCGNRADPGGGSSLVTTPARVSRPQLIKQLDGECLDLNGVLHTIVSSAPNPADAFYDAYSEAVTRMEAGVPRRYLAGFRDFLIAGHSVAGAYGRAGEAAESGDRSLLRKSMQNAVAAKAHFARLAADQGIRYCGNGPDPQQSVDSVSKEDSDSP